MKIRRYGVTLIEILFFSAGIGVALSFAEKAYTLGGYCLAIPCGAIGFFIPWLLACVLVLILDFFFPIMPSKCECKKRPLHQCYFARVGTCQNDDPMFPFLGIVYYRCPCGNEYVKYGWKFFTKVNDDGTLKPYKKRIKWRGWVNDGRTAFEEGFFRIDQKTLARLRDGTFETIDET